MRNLSRVFFILLFSKICLGQPANDHCEQALVIQNVSNYCSADRAFTTVSAAGNDVWFQFTARSFDVNISVSGNTDGTGTLGGTMQNPTVELYVACNTAQIVTSQVSSDNVTSIYKGGLIIGNVYYIRVSGSANGTFKLCVNNYTPVFKPGQDCSTASVLCSKETFTQNDVSGGGMNSDEAAGTCLSAFGVNSEQNSAWYKWTAANNGSLTFVITPTANDDIDWVLYDLGTTNNCGTINVTKAIRCNAGRGVDCFGAGQRRYTKTGLDFASVDLNENGGCLEGQDGFVRFIDMQQGHVYALLVNNFDRGNNGFTIEFDGTGEFLGPQAAMDFKQNNACTTQQDFTFASLSSNYNRLKWTFGEGASLDSANTEGPINVSYSTPGIKTVVLQAFGDKGCSVITSKTFTVVFKPPPPVISQNKSSFCLNETITLSTIPQAGAVFNWTGPNAFTSDQQTVNIPVIDYNSAGVYSLTVVINGCTSDPSSTTIPAINETPVLSLEVTENNPCSNQLSYTVHYTASQYQDIKADFGSGAMIVSGAGNGPFTVTYGSPGIRNVLITATSKSGCGVTASKVIEVSALTPKPLIEINQASFCLNDTITLSTVPSPNTSYVWTGPNNFNFAGSSVNLVVSNVNLAGEYTLVATQGRCSSEAASIIVPRIIPKPVAAFTSHPKIPAKLTAPVTVQFINISTDADTYLWDFGDGSTSAEENPVHTYITFGEFSVTLTAVKSQACSSSVAQGKFILTVDNTIFIPNTFSPNGDQINDEFVVSISNIQSYRLQIFNRYGSPLFQANDIFENWKGVYDSKPLPVGTYYYIIEAISLNGDRIKKSGPISIIK